MVQSTSDEYTIGASYTILTAQSGVAGTFDGLATSQATPFLDFALAYDPTNVFLDVNRCNVSFGSVGMTPNQIATGLERTACR